MKILELDQGSKEWDTWRINKATASRAAVIMDCVPSYRTVKTLEDLESDMVGLTPEPDEYLKGLFKRGHKLEQECRETLFPDFDPCCVELDAGDVFVASFDGLSELIDYGDNAKYAWVEIKSSPDHKENSSVWQTMINGTDYRSKIQDHNWWQLCHQAGVLSEAHAMKCYFTVWIDEYMHETVEVPISPLLSGWKELLSRWTVFLSDQHKREIHRRDHEWYSACEEWREAKTMNDMWKKKFERSKNNLLKLSMDGNGRMGDGVEVVQSTRRGTIDYAKAAKSLYKEKDFVDWAEQYRKPGSIATYVKEIK